MRPLFPSHNPKAKLLANQLARFAPTALPLLLEGETGTGKSFLARRIHRRGRAGRPLVVVDCGAIPETLFPAELFGYVTGAFTDATKGRKGWLAAAAEGTLVLDRVDALSPTSQVVLLRALEERRFIPLGSQKSRPFSARVVALCGPDIQNKIREGRFRSDLYHRLAGFHGKLPPLRDRQEDILPACRSFLAKHDPAVTLTEEAQRLLLVYPWPGNFRELQAVLLRAQLKSSGGEIGVGDLSLPLFSWREVVPQLANQNLTAAQAAKVYALFILAAQGGNVSKAAKVLGVSRRTLIRWRQEL